MSSAPNDLSHYVPRSLDAPPKLIFWEYDVALIVVLGLSIGIGTGNNITGMIVGVIAAFFYGKLKSGRHPGIATHFLYWWTGMPQTKELPGSHLRELTG